MSEKTNIEKDDPTLPELASTTNPDPADTQSAPAASSSEKTHEEEEPEIPRESKRRKGCPKALDKVRDLIQSKNQNSSSFTFDTKFNGYSPESTPKFGSFNLTVQSSKEGEACKEEEKKAAAVVISEEVVSVGKSTLNSSDDGV